MYTHGASLCLVLRIHLMLKTQTPRILSCREDLERQVTNAVFCWVIMMRSPAGCTVHGAAQSQDYHCWKNN